MKEVERIFRAVFGVTVEDTPELNNEQKGIIEYMENYKENEVKKLIIPDVSKWQWLANTKPKLENKIYNVLDKHGKEGKLIFGCSGFMNEPYSFFDSDFIKGSDVIAFC